MSREQYIAVLRDLLSRDPQRIRGANRELYSAAVTGDTDATDHREADLALSEVPQ